MPAPKTDAAAVLAILTALHDDGLTPSIVSYCDGDAVGIEGLTPVPAAVGEVLAVDDATVHFTRDGVPVSHWIRFVMGNDPAEVACDWTVSLDHIIDPILDSWEA